MQMHQITHKHTHTHTHTHSFDYHTVQVKHHTHTHHRQRTLHTITTTYNNYHSVQVAKHAHLYASESLGQLRVFAEAAILNDIYTYYVCIYKWGQVKMRSSTSCRGSRPSWVLVGAGCRVAKSSDRFQWV